MAQVARYGESDLRGPLEALSRLIKSLGTSIPERGDVPDLFLLRGMKADVDAALQAAVDGLRAQGFSWEEIAAGLGVTKAAAFKQYRR